MASIDEQIRADVGGGNFPGGEALVESFRKIKLATETYSVTLIDGASGSLLLRRCLGLLQSDYASEGSFLSFCSETQLNSASFSDLVRAAILASDAPSTLLLVAGLLSANDLNSLSQFCERISTGERKSLRVLVLNPSPSSTGKLLLPETSGRIHVGDDLVFTVHRIFSDILTSKDLVRSLLPKFERLAEAFAAAARVLQREQLQNVILLPETLAITTALLLNRCVGEAEGENALLRTLLQGVAVHLPLSKIGVFFGAASDEPAISSLGQMEALDAESIAVESFANPRRKSEVELKPQMSIEHGITDLFIPTKEIRYN